MFIPEGGTARIAPDTADGSPSWRSPAALVALVIVTGAALRLLLAATIGMSVDESYATVVARSLSPGYFDHPPLSFWIPGLLARATGTERAVVLRLPFILFFAGTTWLTYRIGARLFGRAAGAYAAVLLNLAPVFSVSTGGWVLPDGPLDFFMLAAVLCVARVLLAPTRAPLAWWMGAGLAAGLAALSKYHAVFVPVGVALFLATRREQRRWLRTPGPYAAAAIAAACALPVLYWNARHGWVSFRFQLARGAGGGGGGGGHGPHVVSLLQNLGGQAAYLLPWLWLPLVGVLVAGLRRGPRDAPRWLLCCLAAPPILLFTLLSLGGKPGLPHWPAPGYLMLFPVLGAEVAGRLARGDRRARRWLAVSVLGFGIVLSLAWSQAATGWMTRAFPVLFRRGDPTFEVLDWPEVRPAVAALGALGRDGPFVAATSWIDAGKIGHALGPRTPVLCLCQRPHHFGYLYDQRDFLGRDALLLDQTRGSSDVPRAFAPYFDRIDTLPAIIIRRAGRPALVVSVFRGRTFRAPVPDDLR